MPKAEPVLFGDIGDTAEQHALEAISHKAVRRWLLSWGTAKAPLPPKCGE
jgi:hypothetical protein